MNYYLNVGLYIGAYFSTLLAGLMIFVLLFNTFFLAFKISKRQLNWPRTAIGLVSLVLTSGIMIYIGETIYLSDFFTSLLIFLIPVTCVIYALNIWYNHKSPKLSLIDAFSITLYTVISFSAIVLFMAMLFLTIAILI